MERGVINWVRPGGQVPASGALRYLIEDVLVNLVRNGNTLPQVSEGYDVE